VAQVTWSSRSAADLQSIYEFVRQDAPAAALALMMRLVGAARRLQEFPLSGRVVPEFNRSEIREIIVGHYRIIHRVEGDEVGIVTVRHAARQLGVGNPELR